MRTNITLVLQTLIPVFMGWVGGLYFHAALDRPSQVFTKRECWIMGAITVLAGVVLALNNQFHWIT